ncbi:hypothetical protein THTE_1204 [Thermogutta terrifontis]|uniref:Uncharacterized protein n=1 Tax=Thermogutta terrifontis TaxID=1331910 RepID=A0A286RCW8_9BACT|nr:hypothetical protein THTE_1204 [Thermogutta terrifontis]
MALWCWEFWGRPGPYSPPPAALERMSNWDYPRARWCGGSDCGVRLAG